MEVERAEAELLELLRQGQSTGYELLMRRYNRLLFRAARGIVLDDAEAEGAVQEAYLRAFASLHAFREDCALGTWLVRIVIDQALRQQRKLGRVLEGSRTASPSTGGPPAVG